MTPNKYLNVVVIPTVKEYLAATGDLRLAYLSCQAAFHLCDYVFRSDTTSLADVRSALQSRCPFAFDVVEGIANGSKHAGRDRGAYRHQPGTERDAQPFTVDHSFLDHDRLEIPGLEIVHDGQSAFIDECVRDFLLGAEQAFPQHFSGCDMTGIRA